MRNIPQPNAALAELMEAELEARPFGSFGELATPSSEPPAPEPQPLQIPPPDWEQERIEQARREQAEREQEALPEPETEQPEQADGYPAKP